MIAELHADIVKQITPPEYVYKAQVDKTYVRFNMDKKIDTSHIDKSDPVAKILVENCIEVRVDTVNNKCKIAPYEGNHKAVVMDKVGDYFLNFLKRHMPQKNPQVTKLYKWVSQYTGRYDAPTGSDEEYLMLFRYLNASLANRHAADYDVHVKNGIGILNALKTKYEATGHEIKEVRRGRRRRRRR